MAAGKLQSRLNPDGRREVLVALDAPATATAPDASAHVAPPASADPVDAPARPLDPETVLALADNATQKAEMAVTAYQTLARVAETQVRQSRRQARFAWAAVAVMAAGVTVAVGWTTHRLTRATADAGHMSDEIRQLQQQLSDGAETVRQQSADFETVRAALESSEQALRTELAEAREQAARSDGALAAYKDQRLARQTANEPATRPASPTVAEILAKIAANLPGPAEARLASQTSETSALSDKVEAPTTRSLALRRKVAAPATRPAPASDKPSDSTSASSDTGLSD
jgi:hypothetical protein